MSDFLMVFGKVPGSKSDEEEYFLLHRSTIQAIKPLWAVKENGKYFFCTPGFKGAEIVSLYFIDFHGSEYTCGNVEEWRKLLSEEQINQLRRKPTQRTRIGFVAPNLGDKGQEIDLTEGGTDSQDGNK
jgi:hypothetical protein